MQKLVLDQATLEKLREAAIPVEVVDSQGNSHGRFLLQSRNPLWDLTSHTDEQLEAMARQSGGRTTEELIRDLRKRA
jgi:hypothetical protein